MSKLYVFFGVFLFFISLGSGAIEGKDTVIIGNSNPLAYGIVLVAGENWTCTGALISPDLVITAAHCISQPDGASALSQQLFVHLGSIIDSNHSKDGRWMLVTDIKIHEKFKPNNSNNALDTCSLNDIAILKVDPSGLSDKTATTPIKVSKNISDLKLSKKLTVYGITSSIYLEEYPTLRAIERPKREFLESQNSTCITINWPSDRFDSSEKYTGLVHGDSGGPGLINTDSENLLVGVDSGGDSYTAVPLYIDWINTNAREMNATPPE